MAAGNVFLRGKGGEVFGFTGTGRAMPGFLPIFGGHTIHPPSSSGLKKVYFGEGGIFKKMDFKDPKKKRTRRFERYGEP